MLRRGYQALVSSRRSLSSHSGRTRRSLNRNLTGVWELEQYSEDNSSSIKSQKPFNMLSADVQDIQLNGDKLVFCSMNGKEKLEVARHNGIKCSYMHDDEPRLRMEYDSEDGHVVDERRIFCNGTKLEQTIRLWPIEGDEVVERRYFRRTSSMDENIASVLGLGFLEQRKLNYLIFLMCIQAPLCFLLPSRLWGVIVCLFHAVALCIVLCGSPGSIEGSSAASMETDEQNSGKTQNPKQSTSPEVPNHSLNRMDLAKVVPLGKNEPKSPGSTILRRESQQQQPQEQQYPDVSVGISQVRKRRKGFSTCSEFELSVRTIPNHPNDPQRHWNVWHRYESILQFHKLLESLLETDQTRHSIFTRVVPAIPQRTTKLGTLSRSKRAYEDMLRRRMAGLEEFFVRVFGSESEPELRHKALADPRVRKFLRIKNIMNTQTSS